VDIGRYGLLPLIKNVFSSARYNLRARLKRFLLRFLLQQKYVKIVLSDAPYNLGVRLKRFLQSKNRFELSSL
jgi:hypothetical protein